MAKYDGVIERHDSGRPLGPLKGNGLGGYERQ
jgi:hypothetical protein